MAKMAIIEENCFASISPFDTFETNSHVVFIVEYIHANCLLILPQLNLVEIIEQHLYSVISKSCSLTYNLFCLHTSDTHTHTTQTHTIIHVYMRHVTCVDCI